MRKRRLFLIKSPVYSYAKNFDFGLIEKVFQKFKLAEKYGLIQSDIKEVRK